MYMRIFRERETDRQSEGERGILMSPYEILCIAPHAYLPK